MVLILIFLKKLILVCKFKSLTCFFFNSSSIIHRNLQLLNSIDIFFHSGNKALQYLDQYFKGTFGY